MRDLTFKQAVAQARARFGDKATVERRKCGHYPARKTGNGTVLPPVCSGAMAGHPRPCPGGLPVCQIGHLALGGAANMIKGEGMTFRAALDQVDRRAAWEKWRYDCTPGAQKLYDAIRNVAAALRKMGT